MSNVDRMMLAYIRGQASADDVLRVVEPMRPQPEKTVDELLEEDGAGYVRERQENTWRDVAWYWESLKPDQRRALEQARAQYKV